MGEQLSHAPPLLCPSRSHNIGLSWLIIRLHVTRLQFPFVQAPLPFIFSHLRGKGAQQFKRGSLNGITDPSQISKMLTKPPISEKLRNCSPKAHHWQTHLHHVPKETRAVCTTATPDCTIAHIWLRGGIHIHRQRKK